MPAMNDILAVILGGGRGSRLFPLTKLRSKPAVPIAGKYRLIDIPLSNCINSGIYRIDVLTQFNSHSLHRHINQTYNFDKFHTGFVEILAAEQTPESADWYQGTADALRKQLFQIRSSRAKYVLVLAGDHLYRMDYAPMAKFHWEHNADITVAVHPVLREEAPRLGILKRGQDDRISAFAEKPKDPAVLSKFVSRADKQRPFLGSMGIYLFNTQVLIELLRDNPRFDDFGGDIIPHAIQNCAVYGFDFAGYWRDIGTIRSFYEVNLELTCQNPPFNFFDTERPVYTHSRFLPGSVVEDSHLRDVLLADGCQIQQVEITHSVIGVRSIIAAGTKIKDSVLMGADYYLVDADADPAKPPIGIGPRCHIEGAIIDKNARIGADVVIRPFPRGTDINAKNWAVQDGIVVVPKDSVIPPGTHIEIEKA
ncbi:MAG: glucose-1-phosphate adenylyltransferase [Candidatus Atribacteria bacterium]|nr:glucose-1-phosphate adenylyltransferase [Candidatus Atribacteria bacterium]